MVPSNSTVYLGLVLAFKQDIVLMNESISTKVSLYKRYPPHKTRVALAYDRSAYKHGKHSILKRQRCREAATVASF